MLDTVDGRNPANQLIGSVAHDLQGFLHPRWDVVNQKGAGLPSIFT